MTDNMIHVPAMMDEDRIVIPEFWLGKHVENKRDSNGQYLCASEYNSQMNLPTLAELRHAFEVSADYRKSVLSHSLYGYGEWTSTFLKGSNIVIERPEAIVYKNNRCVLEGGKVTLVELPPVGWVLEYDKLTGFPSRTSRDERASKDVFGADASWFYEPRYGIWLAFEDLAVVNVCAPFVVNASSEPSSVLKSGGRRCLRSE